MGSASRSRIAGGPRHGNRQAVRRQSRRVGQRQRFGGRVAVVVQRAPGQQQLPCGRSAVDRDLRRNRVDMKLGAARVVAPIEFHASPGEISPVIGEVERDRQADGREVVGRASACAAGEDG